MTDKIEDSICPLCQQSNRCDVQTSTACWCMTANVPAGLLAQIPETQRKKSCICQACIQDYYQKAAVTVHKTIQQ